MNPHPWERQPDETEAAYAAFCVFRDLGVSRSVIGAYRQQRGIKGASKASGEWSRLVKAHDWHARVLAWDNHLAAVQVQALDDLTVAEIEEWARRRAARAERDYRTAEDLSDRIDVMIPEQATPRELKDVAACAATASAISWAVINAMIPDTNVGDLDPHTATTEQLTAAIERLEAAIRPAHVPPRIARTG